MPLYDHLSDLLKEINIINNHLQLSANIRDREPLVKRLLNIFIHKGLVSVLEDLSSCDKTTNSDNGLLLFFFQNPSKKFLQIISVINIINDNL